MLALMLLALLGSSPAEPAQSKIQLLFFTASWCQPCRAVERVLQRLERTYGGQLAVTSVDFDKAAEENARWAVRDIPVVIALRNGGPVLRVEGASARELAAFESGVENLLRPPPVYEFDAIGQEEAEPDCFYVMMKLEHTAATAVDAMATGEKRLKEFLNAVRDLKLSNLEWRTTNDALTEPSYGDQGITYVRNVVFTAGAMRPEERDRLISKLEDLGARHNSHCVTCIGSG